MPILSVLLIRFRLLLLLALAAMLLITLGGFSVWTIRATSSQAAAFIDGEFESVNALSDVRAAVGNARRFEKDVFLNMGDEAETERYTKSWSGEIVKVREAINHANTVVIPEEAALLKSLQSGLNNYEAGFKDILGRLSRGELNDPWAANAAMTPLKTDIRQADASLAKLAESVQKRAAQQRQLFAATAVRAPWVITIATTVGGLLAAGVGLGHCAVYFAAAYGVTAHHQVLGQWRLATRNESVGCR
jgi:methyl-accepting chemotaxis protein